ncbi:hypothetical protein DK867_13220 [Ochrobactrum sp. POC9]|uniref:hypothetical protein n=1 Tax=unclassified Ochrobactrum TaxID=239106 RepID=UPI000D7052FD|nr:hypothetical protein [Ochrobactrum sp. POC9]MCH4539213.1 hypothetical protein [Ochrobactrum sp. A-1]PWU72622.1 hypothetical protein DK867_13220 [Ochrobactrum sp. POC9]
MFFISINSNRTLFYSTLLILSGALAGCTTIPPAELCTPAEQKQLKKQHLITQSALDRKEAELSRLKKTSAQNRCVGSLFTPAVKSAQCKELLTRTDRVVTESQTLRERLNELNMALAGRPSLSKYVKSCKASWVASPKKPQSKTVLVRRQKFKATARPHDEMASTIAMPAYETPASAEVEKVDYTSSATVQTSNTTPAYVAPVKLAPPVERPYTSNAKVRVVGSEFFPDQSVPASQPVPDHAPAP